MPPDLVECRSDHAYLGFPLAFYWLDMRLEVTKILSETHDPAGHAFKVVNQEYGCFDLIYDTSTDRWSVRQP